jgi:hypothetical protein
MVKNASLNIDGMLLNGVLIYFDDGGKELEKTCPKCHKRRPISEFGMRQIATRGGGPVIRLQPRCTACR